MANIRQKVIDMLKFPQLSNLATITLDGKPWTRYVMIQAEDNFDIHCAVCVNSRKIKQIERNPEVHLTFGIHDSRDVNKPYVQIQGKAKIVTDEQIKKKFWNEMLLAIFSGPQDPKYGIIMIEPYRVELNNPGSLIPEVWEK
ncbi:MAG: pyridoxamine 5'-phosphate oxidase family protein [Candidatus Omnitrophica bacterium]|nr:pyridoxamine 5'-phosphate oxidase family protein [Candidatus Omnitrophota bacterium]